ncbi:hypothetical protein QBC39DRAFT_375499 [Podospora conica]|nr:hypothetical protein QBC39DRAFT_375499 [Schizothecium conicum]
MDPSTPPTPAASSAAAAPPVSEPMYSEQALSFGLGLMFDPCPDPDQAMDAFLEAHDRSEAERARLAAARGLPSPSLTPDVPLFDNDAEQTDEAASREPLHTFGDERRQAELQAAQPLASPAPTPAAFPNHAQPYPFIGQVHREVAPREFRRRSGPTWPRHAPPSPAPVPDPNSHQPQYFAGPTPPSPAPPPGSHSHKPQYFAGPTPPSPAPLPAAPVDPEAADIERLLSMKPRELNAEENRIRTAALRRRRKNPVGTTKAPPTPQPTPLNAAITAHADDVDDPLRKAKYMERRKRWQAKEEASGSEEDRQRPAPPPARRCASMSLASPPPPPLPINRPLTEAERIAHDQRMRAYRAPPPPSLPSHHRLLQDFIPFPARPSPPPHPPPAVAADPAPLRRPAEWRAVWLARGACPRCGDGDHAEDGCGYPDFADETWSREAGGDATAEGVQRAVLWRGVMGREEARRAERKRGREEERSSGKRKRG